MGKKRKFLRRKQLRASALDALVTEPVKTQAAPVVVPVTIPEPVVVTPEPEPKPEPKPEPEPKSKVVIAKPKPIRKQAKKEE